MPKVELTRGQAVALESALEALQKEGVERPVISIKSFSFEEGWTGCHLRTDLEIWPKESKEIRSLLVNVSCFGHNTEDPHDWSGVKEVEVFYPEQHPEVIRYYVAHNNKELEFMGAELEV